MSDDSAKLATLARLRECNELADFTIICGHKKWRVHRLVLAMHSRVLQKACSGHYEEARKGELDLSEYHEALVHGLINFLYDFEYYYDDSTRTTFEFGETAYHVQMCIMGDKYDIQSLKSLAEAKFEEALCNDRCTAEELANAARYAYDAPGPTAEIRKSIVDIASKNQEIGVNAVEETAIEGVMKECPEFAVEVAKALRGTVASQADSISSAKKLYECENCGDCFQADIRDDDAQFTCDHCHYYATGAQWNIFYHIGFAKK